MLFFLINLLSLFANARGAFPNGRCYVNTCSASPYQFSHKNDTCFVISPKNCIDYSEYDCCNLFKNSLPKFVLKTSVECAKSVKGVYINGVKKGGGVFFDSYGNSEYELRVTSLFITTKDVEMGVEVCFDFVTPCSSLKEFDKDNLVSVFNPTTHTCCPVCNINTNQYSPMSPSPSPIPQYQSPSPPTSQSPLPPSPLPPNQSPLPPSPLPPSPSLPPPSPPTSPSLPPPNQSPSFVLIKVPVKDRSVVQSILCPSLLFAFKGMVDNCKIVFESSTGIYYSSILPMDVMEFKKYVLTQRDEFTKDARLLCGSTIQGKKNGSVYFIYAASRNTCS